ncbi:ABC transporter substrate-binding protein [Eleftheria terrae]|uniref:ABC transporter substrate-binding protein n=1 Tax=Eleftheria terrae TaxID=1597781 RepID=UPI00263B5681|nr:ABC transporter substrate-binding protein [Eleftheria terrae]WKB54048.1 ABC transporter substrate-binding protein [Eleftheria terrae]
MPTPARSRRSAGLLLACALAAAMPAWAGQVEVLHWWTSGGEAKSVAELKRLLAAEGHGWRDFVVAGGGGEGAMSVLRSRVLAGNPPAAAQLKGPAIQEWGRLDVLANLDDVARRQQWDSQLPRVVAEAMKVNGRYVAVPVNVHRINWLWINREALRKVGARAPATWDEFFAVADKMRKAGIVPVAHGGQPWQEFTTFETVALGVGGPDFYRKALVQLDAKALRSETMGQVLETFRRIKGYTDAAAAGREWNAATAMVIRGEAGMQFMGDWAKGEFLAAQKQPNRDFLCVSAPGTARSFIFNIDSFAMFRLKDSAAAQAQQALAATIMSKEFQQVFNLNKGSVPVGTGVDMGKFDLCAQESSAYFVASSMVNALVPSVAHKMALPEKTEAALKDVVAAFWNNDQTSVPEAMDALVKAAQVK